MAPQSSPRGHVLLCCLCLALSCLPRHAGGQSVVVDEGQLLLQIKRAWGDPAQLGSWTAGTTSSRCTNWTYVSCDAAGRVTSLALPNVTLPAGAAVPAAIGSLASLATLDLSNTSVGGVFPTSLYKLTGLTHLDLSSNSLGGELPTDIDRLGANLTYLALDHNNFTGEIPPSVGKLRSLTYLALNENLLTGTVPPELGALINLEALKLEVNPFGPGALPDSFKNLKKLRTVWLSNCNLTGDFPGYFAEMPDMEFLDLSGNGLTGSIPPGIWSLPKLQIMYLYSNSLSGDVVVGNNGTMGATSLIELDISENQLTGTIPESFGSLMNVRVLNLFSNNFSGEIPASLAGLRSVVIMKLFYNKLTGPLPAELGKHSPVLRDIQIDGNDISGPIPAGICDNRALWILSASGNRLNGSIPASLATCPALISLQLQDNRLSGEVPPELWTETKLITLLLQDNGGLTGTLPDKLFWNLTRLFLDNNRFTGPVPASATRLQKFHAANNSFSGDIPKAFPAGMGMLQELDLSLNRLSGAIPPSIASLNDLTQMNFSGNRLTGEIPPTIGSMPVLTLLDLSSNQLSGAIPPALGSLRVNQLNLSSNQLTGEIPAAFATAAYEQSFAGNPNLCTSTRQLLTGVRACGATSSPDRVSPGLRAGLLAAGAALLVLIAGLAFLAARDIKRRKRNLAAAAEEEWKLTPFQPLEFSEAALLRGLSDDNLVGKGGSGRVYRVAYANRARGGTVAVKRVWTGAKLDTTLEREFEAEVGILGHIRHTNIVKLLCCLSRAETKLLVYEYMDYGSLDKWLHGHKWVARDGGVATTTRVPSVRRAPLDWPARVRVAVGAARGLCYMHHECSPPIVHRDVKSSNILLDSELNAKVADFGLARMLAEAGKPDTVSAVAGTFGYMAPECGYTRKVNEKVDVYSFGVVLLELTTGREANDGGEHGSLAQWAWRYLQSGKSIADAADKCVRNAGYGDEIEAVFKLGIICTGAQPATRPTMKDVLQILLRCEQAYQKSLDEKVAEFDAAPLIQVRGGSRRKQFSDAKVVDDGEAGFDSSV
ncbi:hypothetical protein QOZ80_5AG0366080 [Eleusine coracana subsp. coracana]|nr:hypothetical protein QOZ80_5AG0366080 [Eleusine coracana subsp. coracana]